MYYTINTEVGDKEHEEKYGYYNSFPPNWEEITEKEFVQSYFFVYNPVKIEWRQMYEDINFDKPAVHAILYYFHDGNGVAISSEYWQGKLRYYKFGLCYHDFRSATHEEIRKAGRVHFGNCYHIEVCKKCGYMWEYDSSG